MRKPYETMEAYKVNFNANEQIAAAACDYYPIGGKYGGGGAEPAQQTCYMTETQYTAMPAEMRKYA